MPKCLATMFLIALIGAAATAAETVPTDSFAFSFDTVLEGTPETVWEAATGDILPWWDHTMSGEPIALEIQVRPGGMFLETFDETGDGVRHAVVTYADRGEKLRMEGPMGLAGFAVHMVTTWSFAPGEDEGTTVMTVEVHGAGELYEGWPDVVESTWEHFIRERLAPYLKGELAD